MSVQIEFKRIQQIFDVETGFGLPFDGQLAGKKECIRVLFPACQAKKVAQFTSNHDIRMGTGLGDQPRFLEAEIEPAGNVLDVQKHGLTLDLDESRGNILSSQRVVEHSGEHATVNGIGDAAKKHLQGEQGQFGRFHGCTGLHIHYIAYQRPCGRTLTCVN